MAQWERALAMEAWAPEYRSPSSMMKKGKSGWPHISDLSTKQVETRGLTGIPVLETRARVSERPCFNGIRQRLIKQDTKILFTHTHSRTHTDTHFSKIK